MNNRLLWDGYEVELSEVTNIALTRQVNNVGDLSNRQGDFSNVFRVPKSQSNKYLFDYIDNLTSISELYKRVVDVDYFQDGEQILYKGKGVIDKIDENYFYLKVNSGNTDFFNETLNNRVGKLYAVERINLKNYFDGIFVADRGYAFSNFITDNIAVRDGSEFYIFPIIDGKEKFDLLSNSSYDVRSAVICLFVKDVFERVAIINGFELKGSFIDSAEYPKLLLSNDNMDYSDLMINGEGGFVENGLNTSGVSYSTVTQGWNSLSATAITIFVPNTGGGTGQGFTYYYDYPSSFDTGPLVDFTQVSALEPSGNPDIGVGVQCDLVLRVLAELNIQTSGGSPKLEHGLTVYILDYTTDEIIYEKVILDERDDITASNITYNFDEAHDVKGVIIHPSHEYRTSIRVKIQEDDLYDVDVTLYTTGSITSSPTLTLTPSKIYKTQIYGGVYFIYHLFNIKILDLFKDLMNQYCVITQTNNLTKEVYFNYLDDLYKNMGIKEDWSEYVDVKKSTLTFEPLKYGNKSEFKYADNEGVVNGYGNATIETNNEATEKQTVIQLKTSATEEQTATFNSIIVPHIRMYDKEWNFKRPNARILLYEKENTAYNIDFTDGTNTTSLNTDIPFARFEPLKFENLLTERYKVIRRILEEPKKVMLILKLPKYKFKNFNFITPIYLNVVIGGSHIQGDFYVNKIGNYKDGFASVEFVKI